MCCSQEESGQAGGVQCGAGGRRPYPLPHVGHWLQGPHATRPGTRIITVSSYTCSWGSLVEVMTSTWHQCGCELTSIYVVVTGLPKAANLFDLICVLYCLCLLLKSLTHCGLVTLCHYMVSETVVIISTINVKVCRVLCTITSANADLTAVSWTLQY